MSQVVLVSNGPGELYTWVAPVVRELRRALPDARVSVALVPCQFAAGNEPEVAASFGPDHVSRPAEYLRALAAGTVPAGLADAGAGPGAVVGLGGSAAAPVALGRRLRFPAFRYSFEPYWHRGLELLLLPDEKVRDRALRRGSPGSALRVVGNLVADAVEAAEPPAERGDPHVLVFAGSRDQFALHLIPFMIALVDRLARELPRARFVWPVSRMLRPRTLEAGIAGEAAATLAGAAGRREGDVVYTPGGGRIELVPEEQRYAHMRAADLAVTIPGTNTLELGVAGVPALVLLPLNRPELIPLEGAGHWLGLVPLVGRYLKRYAVRLFVERLAVPVSLPNRITGEDLMVEVSGRVHPDAVAERALALVADEDDLARRRRRLRETMPRPGAAAALVDVVASHAGL
ncbi:MAG TPA: hypothetical protein VF202_14170 [Trueperaceae bacterium]|jgi:lipid-A-disaccharide synthase